jgi:hypothetical protein
VQTNNAIPFNFYDHVAVLFPGFILLSYIYLLLEWLFPQVNKVITDINTFSPWILVLICIIISFICGHIAYFLSKAIVDFFLISDSRKFSRTLFRLVGFYNQLISSLIIISSIIEIVNSVRTDKSSSKEDIAEEDEEDAVKRNKYLKYNKLTDCFYNFSNLKQNIIVSKLEGVYGEKLISEIKTKLPMFRDGEINGPGLGILNYCFAVVERKEIKHDKFITIADFLRSISVLMLLGFFILLIRAFYLFLTGTYDGILLLKYIVVSLIIGVLAPAILMRSFRMRKAADSVIYSQFLYDVSSNNEK